MIVYESNTLVPESLAMSMRELMLSWNNINPISQQDQSYDFKHDIEKFGSNFDTIKDKSWFPNHDEYFTSRWDECDSLGDHDLFTNIMTTYIEPKFREITGIQDKKRQVLSFTRMPAGGHYRLHQDSKIAKYGFVWYLNIDWKWDWGGLLLTVDKDGNANINRPIFNNFIILKHTDSVKKWHCVTRVEDYANEPRLSIVAFII